MGREITRRDFLNGVAIGVGGSLLGSALRPRDLLAGVLDDFPPEKALNYYPPALMGMRGNHEGTYTFAYRLRDGEAADSFGKTEDTGEHSDLFYRAFDQELYSKMGTAALFDRATFGETAWLPV